MATTGWHFLRYKGTFEEYKAESDSLSSPKFFYWAEEQKAKSLLRFAQEADPSVPIRVAMDDLLPLLDILDLALDKPGSV